MPDLHPGKIHTFEVIERTIKPNSILLETSTVLLQDGVYLGSPEGGFYSFGLVAALVPFLLEASQDGVPVGFTFLHLPARN